MLLIDKKLFKQGASMIEPFDEEQVTNIGYDLRTDCFFWTPIRPERSGSGTGRYRVCKNDRDA